jgi:hypothetical protein
MDGQSHSSPHIDTSATLLRDAFRNAVEGPLSDSLRHQICAYVDASKAEGAQVEHVIVRIKDLMRQAPHRMGLRLTPSSSPTINGDTLIANVVALCVQHYYNAKE